MSDPELTARLGYAELSRARLAEENAILRRQIRDLEHARDDALAQRNLLHAKVSTVLDNQRPRAAVRILRKWLETQ